MAQEAKAAWWQPVTDLVLPKKASTGDYKAAAQILGVANPRSPRAKEELRATLDSSKRHVTIKDDDVVEKLVLVACSEALQGCFNGSAPAATEYLTGANEIDTLDGAWVPGTAVSHNPSVYVGWHRFGVSVLGVAVCWV